jgi:hypothetical protein
VSAQITGASLGEVWENSLALFATGEGERFASQRGPCSEVSDVILQAPVGDPAQDISSMYPREFVALVDTYARGFLPSREPLSTVSRRLYHWPHITDDGHAELDQVARLVDQLRTNPVSRFNVVGLWDPATDPSLQNPVSPITCNFRLRHGQLDGTLVARTVDAWIGAFPMFVGFARLLRYVASRIEATAGRALFHVFSYHVYDMDLPVVRRAAATLAR